MSDPNQMSSIVVIVPCGILTEDQLMSNDYFWVVAFKKKGNLLKDMASNKTVISHLSCRTSSAF